MREIKLTKGFITLVDDEDFEYLSKFKWFHQGGGRFGYASRQSKKINGRQKQIRMHRVIMGAGPGHEVDHINGNSLDNRRCNLRLVSRSQNMANTRIRKDNKSGLKGVSWHKRVKKWVAQISFNKKKIHLGYFDSVETAHSVYLSAAKRLFGEFSNAG